MRVSRGLDDSQLAEQSMAPTTESDHSRPWHWPLAAAVIAALSVGLWLLIVGIGRTILG